MRDGKTPILSAENAHHLFASFDPTQLSDVRNRALLGVMVHSFARVSAVVKLRVRDDTRKGARTYFVPNAKRANTTRFRHTTGRPDPLQRIWPSPASGSSSSHRETGGSFVRLLRRAVGVDRDIDNQPVHRPWQIDAVAKFYVLADTVDFLPECLQRAAILAGTVLGLSVVSP